MVHELKTWPEQFADVKYGSKRFEIRKNDRNYHVGDILLLKEYDPETKLYSGNSCKVEVTFCMTTFPCKLVEEGSAVMSIKLLGD